MKIKLLLQLLMITCLGSSSVSYGDPITCAALRTSQAHEKGDLTEQRLQELYHLWKEGLNKIMRQSYDTEDPISTYEDFKIVFGLGKKRIQVTCPIDNMLNCADQIMQRAHSRGKEVKIVKKIINTDDNVNEFLLEETETLLTGLSWAYLHYYECDDNLDNIINELSLLLKESMKGNSNSQKEDL